MARINVPLVAVRGTIGLIASATVYVTKRSDGEPATLYTAETGGTTTPNPATTDAAGRVNAWVEEESYNALVTPPAGLGLSPWAESFEGASGGLNARLGSVESGRVVDARDWGIKDDGADYTTALQAAFNGTPAAHALMLPPFEIAVSGQISWPKSINIWGQGWHFTPQDPFGHAFWNDPTKFDGSCIRSSYTGGPALRMAASSGGQNGSLRDFLVVGPGSGTNSGIKLGKEEGTAAGWVGSVHNVAVLNFALCWELLFVEQSVLRLIARGCHTGVKCDEATNANTFLQPEVQFSDTDAMLFLNAANNTIISPLLQNISGTAGIRFSTGLSASNRVLGGHAEGFNAATWAVYMEGGQHHAVEGFAANATAKLVRVAAPFCSVKHVWPTSGAGTVQIDAAADGTVIENVPDNIITDNGIRTHRSAADEAVITPTFAGTWGHFSTPTFQAAGYYKDRTGRVWLQGLVKSTGADTTIFTLPAGYRLASQALFAAISDTTSVAARRVNVKANGDVTADTPGPYNGWLSLDGISFRV